MAWSTRCMRFFHTSRHGIEWYRELVVYSATIPSAKTTTAVRLAHVDARMNNEMPPITAAMAAPPCRKPRTGFCILPRVARFSRLMTSDPIATGGVDGVTPRPTPHHRRRRRPSGAPPWTPGSTVPGSRPEMATGRIVASRTSRRVAAPQAVPGPRPMEQACRRWAAPSRVAPRAAAWWVASGSPPAGRPS